MPRCVFTAEDVWRHVPARPQRAPQRFPRRTRRPWTTSWQGAGRSSVAAVACRRRPRPRARPSRSPLPRRQGHPPRGQTLEVSWPPTRATSLPLHREPGRHVDGSGGLPIAFGVGSTWCARGPEVRACWNYATTWASLRSTPLRAADASPTWPDGEQRVSRTALPSPSSSASVLALDQWTKALIQASFSSLREPARGRGVSPTSRTSETRRGLRHLRSSFRRVPQPFFLA